MLSGQLALSLANYLRGKGRAKACCHAGKTTHLSCTRCTLNCGPNTCFKQSCSIGLSALDCITTLPWSITTNCWAHKAKFKSCNTLTTVWPCCAWVRTVRNQSDWCGKSALATGSSISNTGADLVQALQRALDHGGLASAWQRDLNAAEPLERWRLARGWLRAFAATQATADGAAPGLAWIDDAATALTFQGARRRINTTLDAQVAGLRSEHARIQHGALAFNLNDFRRRVRHHRSHAVQGFTQLQALRHELLVQEKARLHLAQFQAKPLATFVRNRLIDEVYLPLVGNNLAKQLGAAGDSARTDRMGMLLLISPPGYGKTTLMEYVANRLGLVFVRINCPALGHGVTSIDPSTAPNSAARQELEKLNLGLAMGSNVMLYLDDIQHTHPEFLQKFIALADGTRRIEGVWQGQPRTWDMRGKRFAIVMAGKGRFSNEGSRWAKVLADRG